MLSHPIPLFIPTSIPHPPHTLIFHTCTFLYTLTSSPEPPVLSSIFSSCFCFHSRLFLTIPSLSLLPIPIPHCNFKLLLFPSAFLSLRFHYFHFLPLPNTTFFSLPFPITTFPITTFLITTFLITTFPITTVPLPSLPFSSHHFFLLHPF